MRVILQDCVSADCLLLRDPNHPHRPQESQRGVLKHHRTDHLVEIRVDPQPRDEGYDTIGSQK